MTKEEYKIEINNYYNIIDDCKYAIHKKNDQISELQYMIKRMKKLHTTVKDVSDSSKKKMNTLDSLFYVTKKITTGKFFRDNKAIYKGADYKCACQGINSSIKQAYTRIDTLLDEIKELNSKINFYEYEIIENKNAINRLENEKKESR